MVTRILTALGVLVSAAAHLWLWFDGFRDISVIGPLFMVNAVAGVVIAAGVMAWRSWVPLFLAVGFGACTGGAFILSATVGLFGLHEIFWGTWQVIALASEILAVVAGCIALYRENRPARTGRNASRSSTQVSADR
jgi:hypothetical protein